MHVPWMQLLIFLQFTFVSWTILNVAVNFGNKMYKQKYSLVLFFRLNFGTLDIFLLIFFCIQSWVCLLLYVFLNGCLLLNQQVFKLVYFGRILTIEFRHFEFKYFIKFSLLIVCSLPTGFLLVQFGLFC